MAKILYFVEGTYPTDEELVEANEIGANIRSVTMIEEYRALEDCDFIYGCAPDNYKKEYSFYGQVEEKKEEEKTSQETVFGKMSVKELDQYAADNGIAFPAEVKSKGEKAAHLESTTGQGF